MKLNSQQLEAAERKRPGPMLIVAGAGTGKTRVICERFSFLVKNGLAKEHEILALTFTDKAAGEMEERIDADLPLGHDELNVMTFHSFGKMILEEFALQMGWSPRFKLLTSGDQYLLVRKNLDKFNLKLYKPQGNPSKFLEAMLKLISRAKDEEIDAVEYSKYAKKLSARAKKNNLIKDEARLRKEEADFYNIYEELLVKEGAMDFGDLIIKTLMLFREHPSVLEKIRKRYKYVLVDEFQDTNTAQYKLVKILAEPKNNIMVVGDDDQSLYRWRGAAISNILNFKKDYPKSHSVVLNQNYRSTGAILDLAYKSICNNNPNRLECKIKINKKLKAIRSGEKPRLVETPSYLDEAEFVVSEIQKLNKEGADLKDMAILIRSNRIAEPFISALERSGVDYDFVSASGLYKEKIVRDAFAYLRAVANPGDNLAIYAMLESDIWKIDTLDLYRISSFAKRKTKDLFEIIAKPSYIDGLSDKSKSKLSKIFSFLESDLKNSEKKGAVDLVVRYVKNSGYDKILRESETYEDRKRFENFNLFFRQVQEFEIGGSNRNVKDFVAEIDMALESGIDPAPANLTEDVDSVKLTTIHKAKGLEFSVVFVVGLVDGTFPARERPDTIELASELSEQELAETSHAEEERRLFYVATTRAKDKLYLTYAIDYGGKKEKKVSRFIKEILDQVIFEKYKSQDLPWDIDTKIQTSEEITIKNKKAEEVKYKLPNVFSFTQVSAFAHCPLQYKYAHILGLKSLKRRNYVYGQSIHDALRYFFEAVKSKKKYSKRLLLDLLKKHWISEWYESKADEKESFERAENDLAGFYEELILGNKEFTKTEQLFIEKEFKFKIGEFNFRGKVDRVQKLPNGIIELIDYKTGTSKKSETPKKKFAQLLLYVKGIKDVFGITVDQVTLQYIGGEFEKDTIKLPSKLLNKVLSESEQTLSNLCESDFPPNPSKHECKYCDFNIICPYRK